jgi:O-antigen/teichoic acid export membrane protein
VLGSADRFILERLVSLEEVGIYNVGYQLGLGMSVMAGAANNTLIPLYGRMLDSEKARRDVVVATTYYAAAVVCVALGLSLFGEDLVTLFTPPSYHAAGSLIPWVVLGYVFFALYFPPTNLLALTYGRSSVIGLATGLGAIVNVGLNFAVIPFLGIMGAAATTALTYFVMMTSVAWLARRTAPLPIEKRRVGLLLAAGAIVFAVGWAAAPEALLGSLAVKALALGTFPCLLWPLGFYSVQEKAEIRRATRALFARFS